MKKWIEENWDQFVFGVEAITFCLYFIGLIFGSFIIASCFI